MLYECANYKHKNVHLLHRDRFMSRDRCLSSLLTWRMSSSTMWLIWQLLPVAVAVMCNFLNYHPKTPNQTPDHIVAFSCFSSPPRVPWTATLRRGTRRPRTSPPTTATGGPSGGGHGRPSRRSSWRSWSRRSVRRRSRRGIYASSWRRRRVYQWGLYRLVSQLIILMQLLKYLCCTIRYQLYR